jgi:restriction system protein
VPRSRTEHPLVALTRLPWWVSVAFAVVVFTLLHWALPAVIGPRSALWPLAFALAKNAWWIAGIFLLPAPFALFNARHRRRLVDGQTSVDHIRALPWQEFERLVGEAYRRQGYRVTERGGAGADGGIDLELQAKDKKLVVQCKCWKTRTVGVELVRELYGAMAGEEAHGAIFVTSGGYTPDAIDFARDKPIKLVDGPELVAMLQQVQGQRQGAGRSIADRRPAPQPVGPVVTTAAGAMTCPRCGSPMVRRVANQGAGAGSEFWGCKRFPDCRGTRPAG